MTTEVYGYIVNNRNRSMANTITPAEIERLMAYNLAGWSVPDDDLPNAPTGPEPNPLDSAQSRRAWRESAPQTVASPIV